MKVRIIIGVIVIAGFTAFGIYSLADSQIDYTSASKARESGRKAQIKGTWVRDKGAKYNSVANEFTFTLRDEENSTVSIRYMGAQPNNFDIAESVVVKGKFEGDEFVASEILTKCPSKYEADGSELQKEYK